MRPGHRSPKMVAMTRDRTPSEHPQVAEGAPPGGAERPPGEGDLQPGGASRLASRVSAPHPVVRAAEVLDGAVLAATDAVKSIVPAPQPVVRAASVVEGAVGAAVGAATRRWDERPGARVRRIRRLAREPLPYLYDLHPEARQAT